MKPSPGDDVKLRTEEGEFGDIEMREVGVSDIQKIKSENNSTIVAMNKRSTQRGHGTIMSTAVANGIMFIEHYISTTHTLLHAIKLLFWCVVA